MLLVAAALVQICAATAPATAQEAPAKSNSKQPPVIYIQLEDRWVPATVLGELSKATAESGAADPSAAEAPQPRVPDYYVSQLRLEGTADGDRAEMTVEAEVHIMLDKAWVEVPLRLNQGFVTDVKHEGEGQAMPATSPSRDEGLRWRFRGTGSHRLTFHMQVPLRRTGVGRQLQLTLPQMPRGFAARLQLDVPEKDAIARGAGDTQVRPVPREDGGTRLEADITGTRLDVSWQPAPQQQDVTVSRVTTNFLLDRSSVTNSLELSALQELQTDSGVLSSVVVTLPDDFEFISVTGRRYLDHEVDDEAKTITVELDDRTSDPVQLEWLFRRDFSEPGDTVVINGLRVEGARQEVGEVNIAAIPDYRVSRVRDDSPDAPERVSVSNVTQGNVEKYVTAFKFYRQPFRIALDIRKEPPSYTSTAEYELVFGEKDVTLNMSFFVQVERGSVDQIPLEWAENEDSLWQDIRVVADSKSVTAAVVRAEDGSVSIRLPKSATGAVRFDIQARRPLEPTGGSFEFALPTTAASIVRPAELQVRAADSVDVELKSIGDSVIQPQMLSASPSLSSTSPAEYRVISRWLIASPQRRLRASIAIHERQVSARTLVRLRDFVPPRGQSPGSLTIEQTIEYRVQYGRLSFVRLAIPDGFAASTALDSEMLRFSVGGIRLPETAVEQDGSLVRVNLPTAAARFELQLRPSSVPVAWPSDNEPMQIEVPVLQPVDVTGNNSKIVCEMADAELGTIEFDNPLWERLPLPAYEAPQWARPGTVESILITLDDSLDAVPQKYTIESAYLVTRWESELAHTRAEYNLIDPGRQITFQMPPTTSNIDVAWEGLRLPADKVQPSPVQAGQFVLDLPSHDARSGRLVIQYESSARDDLGFLGSAAVPFPRFPPGVWIQRTVWEVQLPPGFHVFRSPRQMSPQFTWSRDGLFWQRKLTPNYLAYRATLASTSEIDNPTDVPPGNVYAYSTYGVEAGGDILVISRSMIVLCGAGMTFVLAFVLLKVNQTRHVLTLAVVGLLLSIAALWYAEPLAVLWQSGVFGVLLALLGLATDWFSRQRTQPLLTLPADDDDYADLSAELDAGRTESPSPHGSQTVIRPTTGASSATGPVP